MSNIPLLFLPPSSWEPLISFLSLDVPVLNISVYVKSYNSWPFVSGFSDLAGCLQGPSLDVTRVWALFLSWLTTCPLYGWTTVCLCIGLLLDSWVVSTFWLPRLMLPGLFLYKPSVGGLWSVLLGVPLGVELLGQTVILHVTFWRIAEVLPQQLYGVTVPPAMCAGPSFCTPVPMLGLLRLFNDRQPTGCRVVARFCISLMMWNIFPCICQPLVYL